MADNRQVLIHLHTGEVKAPTSNLIELGEIAVQHNENEAALYVKKNGGEISKFIDSTAVDSKVDAEKTRAEGVESTLNTAITTEKTRAEGAEEALSERIDSLTGSSHSHDNKTVLDGVTAEKVAAWDGAVSKEHTHDNKALLDSYTQTEENLSDAVAKKHEHTNKAVLDGVSAEKVADWDAAEQNAKDYADSLAGNYDIAGAAAGALNDAKAYADGLASNYDAAGAAAGALNDAKAYADGLASNYDAAGTAESAIEALDLENTYAVKSVENTISTLVGEDTNKSVRTVAAEEVAKIVNGADESFDTLKEIADWIQSDTTGAAGMAADIDALQAISADTRLETLEGVSHSHTNKTILDGVSAEKVADWDAAEQNAKDYADDLNTAMDGRVDALEAISGQSHTHSNKALLDTYAQTEANLADAVAKKHEHANKTVLDGVSAEKVAAWDASEQNAKDYADGAATGALNDAKAYADDLNTAMDGRVDALEAISGQSHTHSNKALLDTYTQTEADLADAVAKKHEHANKTVLDGVSAEKVTAWDAAEGNAIASAKTYTDTLVSTLRIDCGTF